MMFQEPKVEFMAIKMEDIITASGGAGSQINICQGDRPGEDQDDCSGEVM